MAISGKVCTELLRLTWLRAIGPIEPNGANTREGLAQPPVEAHCAAAGHTGALALEAVVRGDTLARPRLKGKDTRFQMRIATVFY